MIALAMTVAAQDEVKKVAILKAVDEYNDVSGGVKLNLRASLTYAINHMEGYEAYTRVNLSAIMDEQAFQRSGYVSDDQIKELGKMTGASYVLVAEVANYDEENIVLTAYIYDVETGRIKESSQPEIASIEPSMMKESCIQIARTLLGKTASGKTSASLSEKERKLRAQGWVDLGLSVYWKDNNESGDFYTYDQAVSKFGRALPTKEQFEELKNKCRWTWTGNGYNIIGPNGNSIYLPADGFRNCNGYFSNKDSYGLYWSSTPSGSENAWYLSFTSGKVGMGGISRCNGRSVRLVKEK